jgi:hypothetical protein
MKVKVKRRINAPSNVLWSYLADYSNINRFNPLLKKSEFIEGTETCEIGSTRQCEMKDGNHVKERIIDWKEGSHYSVEIYDTSMPMIESKATMGLNKLSTNETEAYMHMEVTPKNKLMQPMMYFMFRYKMGPAILKGLEDLYKEEHTVSMA